MRQTWQRVAWGGTVLFGGLHALASLSWGLGGTWLLDTVGQGAVELRRDASWWVFAVMLLIGLLKIAGVAVPIANARGLLPLPRLWRVLSWLGALGLTAYGVVLTVVSSLALAGLFGPVEDRRGMVGHAYLWDPLFAAWGLCLVAALLLERRRVSASGRSKTTAANRPLA